MCKLFSPFETGLLLILLVASECHLGHELVHHSHTQLRLQKKLRIDAWETNSQTKLKKTSGSETESFVSKETLDIVIDDRKTYQIVDGFGFTLTGGSAMLINKMNSVEKNALI